MGGLIILSGSQRQSSAGRSHLAGFTLLEVIVALAIVGTLFFGITVALQEQSRVQAGLEKRMAAAQLGVNLQELIRLQADKDLLSEGREKMAGYSFNWKMDLSNDSDSGLSEYRLQVMEGKEILFETQWAHFDH